jgi:hypothetical protein
MQLASFIIVPSAAPAAVHVYVIPMLRTPVAPTLALRLAAQPQHNCGSSARRATADGMTAARSTRRAPVLHAGRRTAGMRADAHDDVPRSVVHGLERVRRDLEVLRRGSKRKFLDGERPIVEMHFGATGSGKTRAVLEKYPDA